MKHNCRRREEFRVLKKYVKYNVLIHTAQTIDELAEIELKYNRSNYPSSEEGARAALNFYKAGWICAFGKNSSNPSSWWKELS